MVWAWDHPNARWSSAWDKLSFSFHSKAQVAGCSWFHKCRMIFLGGYQQKPGYGMGCCGLHQESAEIPALHLGMRKWPKSVWDAFVNYMCVYSTVLCLWRCIWQCHAGLKRDIKVVKRHYVTHSQFFLWVQRVSQGHGTKLIFQKCLISLTMEGLDHCLVFTIKIRILSYFKKPQ